MAVCAENTMKSRIIGIYGAILRYRIGGIALDSEFHIYYISLIDRKNCVFNMDGFAAALSRIFCAAAKGPNATL